MKLSILYICRRLCLYPNRDKENNGSGYLSLYLIIVDTDAYPLNWEVHVTFKFFLFDKKHDQYLVVQGKYFWIFKLYEYYF